MGLWTGGNEEGQRAKANLRLQTGEMEDWKTRDGNWHSFSISVFQCPKPMTKLRGNADGDIPVRLS